MMTLGALSILSCFLPGSLGVIQASKFTDVGYSGRQIIDAKYSRVSQVGSPGFSTSSCASWCATLVNCTAFSIVLTGTEGQFACLISDGTVMGTKPMADSITYYRLNMKHGTPCIDHIQCYSGFQTMTCVSWACKCPAGRAVSSDKAFCSIVDSQGFSYYLDGYSYKRLQGANASSLSAARAACAALNTAYGLPIPYPNQWTRLALTRVTQAGDKFYVGMTLQYGSTLDNRAYVTDNGTLVNASQKLADQAQHWATGQPNSLSLESGAAVVMTSAGWDDVPSTTPVNSVICAKPSTFEYQEVTGKFYSMRNSPLASYSDARAICQSEGGDLAITYGTEGFQVMQHYATQVGASYRFWIAGNDEAEEGNWVFPDGMSLKVSDKDPRSHWEATQPNAGTSGNCLYSVNKLWSDMTCSVAYGFLCERDA